MKGIILAGGSGTRLYPLTRVVSKQLLPVYDKPMIYYPLSTLMLAGIRDILVISTPQDLPRFRELLGTGQQWGLRLRVRRAAAARGARPGVPHRPEPSSARSGWPWCSGTTSSTGTGCPSTSRPPPRVPPGRPSSPTTCEIPERYGVVELGQDGRAVSIEEKPAKPRSNYAVTGLYFYDNRVLEIAASLRPSARGELEITDVNRAYLEWGELHVEVLGRGFAWLDTGTHESLQNASTFIEIVERRQGLKVSCIEEIAFRMGYIGPDELRALAEPMRKNDYGQYLLDLLENRGAIG